MSYHRGKLKNLIALGGIALALLPYLQQTHALCRLAGCIDRGEQSLADITSTAIADRGSCCGGGQTSVPCEFSTHNQDDDSPCGPECRFVKPADPCKAPRGAIESVMFEILTARIAVTLNCDLNSPSLSTRAPSALDDLPFTSSCETCARLCRFLT